MKGRDCRRVLTTLAVALVALAGARPATAEEAAAAEGTSLAPGTRVRVTTTKSRLVGRLVEEQVEAIVVAREREGRTETLAIDRQEIVGLEVSQRPSRKGKGMTIGILAGAAAAVVIGVVGGESCPSDPGPAGPMNWGRLESSLCIDHAEAALLSGLVTVPLGVLLGAAIAPGEKWRAVPAQGISVQAVAFRRGDFGVRVAIVF
jgi:hypothetical protein